MNSMIKAIIFDCFGVIYVDTLAILERKYIKDSPAKIEKIHSLRRLNDQGLVERTEFWSGVAEVLGLSADKVIEEIESIDGADWELLEYIKSLKNNYKTAILSNVGRDFLERIFDNKDHRVNYFNELVASGDIGFVKPDPRSYLSAADKLGVSPEECIFIDDLEHLADGARQVGMQAIVYKGIDDLKLQLDKIVK